MKLLTLLIVLFSPFIMLAQEEDMSLDARVTRLEKEPAIRFGMSIGWRKIPGKDYVDAFIDPVDSTLQSGARDDESMILSAVISVMPFSQKESWVKNIGFIANVNIADIAGDDALSVNNKSIEGGFGLSYSLSSSFAIGFTFERVFDNTIRREILVKYEGQKLYKNGQVVTDLNPDDDQFFRKDDRDAYSIKFIYFL